MIIIGEKINGSIPAVAKAIAERDAEFIKERARKQAAANATYIDCCASVPEEVEVETLKWMIECIPGSYGSSDFRRQPQHRCFKGSL